MNFSSRHAAVAICMAVALGASAQQDCRLTVHYKGNTTQSVDLNNVDSITFHDGAMDGAVKLELPVIAETYVKQKFTPVDKSSYFYMSYLDRDEFDLYESDEALVADDKLWFEEMAKGYNTPVSDIVASFCGQGDFEEWQAGLLPGHQYVIWCHGVDENGNNTTPVTKYYFTTKSVTPIANRVQMTCTKTDNGVQVTYTPDDDTLPYTAGYVPAANVTMGSSVKDYMQQSLSEMLYDYLATDEFDNFFEQHANKGALNLTYTGFGKNTVYYLVAGYLDADGAINSALTIATVNADGTVSEPQYKEIAAKHNPNAGVKRNNTARKPLR